MLSSLIGFLRKRNILRSKLERYTSRMAWYKVFPELSRAALTSRSAITSPPEINRDVIVSFTTFGDRIEGVHLVVESIAQQTIKPNRVILWLDEQEYSINIIPEALQRQVSRGLDVRFCPNYKSYKKLVPTLRHYPDSQIITIDDDTIYPKDMIERLLGESERYPKCVISNRARTIKILKSGALCPYRNWSYINEDLESSMLTFPVGVGGVLYSPYLLDPECTNDSLFMKLAPDADDVWFKAMSLLSGVECRKVADKRDFFEHYPSIPGSQHNALTKSNLMEGGNDLQIRNVFDYFDLYDCLGQA